MGKAMKILKRPDGLIFDTENPNSIEFNPVYQGLGRQAPLYRTIDRLTHKSDWEYLRDYFHPHDGKPHYIFKDFESSFFYYLKV